MNKDVEKAKELIAEAFNNVLTIESAAEAYYDLRRFVTKAFDIAVQDIIAEQQEEETEPDEQAEEIPDCKQCRRFFVCEGDRIVDHRASKTHCPDFIEK